MKTCPHCGYENKKSAREITRLWRIKFGDLPIWEMLRRRWIAGTIETPIEHIQDELRRFFGLETVNQLDAFLESPTMPAGMVCLDIEARYAADLAARQSAVATPCQNRVTPALTPHRCRLATPLKLV